MKHIFTISLCFLALSLSVYGQVPDYVPSDGLVAWWNMYDNGLDSSPNQIHPINEGYQAGIDRFGNEAGCFDSQGTHIDYGVHPEIYNESFTFSAWINPTSATTQRTFMGYHQDQTGGATLGLIPSNQIKFHTNVIGYGNTGEQGVVSSSPLQANVWTSVVGTYSMGVMSLYLNGVLDTQLEGVSPPTNIQDNFQVGKWTGGNQYFGGLIDDIGLWNRALSETEIQVLYTAEIPISGCTDETACNFNQDATFDDGSCIPSGCMDTYACNYNQEADCDDGSCDYSCCPGPGCCSTGMYWDWELDQCFDINPTDTNLDGCTDLNDLMDILSAYGNCAVVEFTCGDPLEYQGYDYETVQIGDQCWFAENCRYLPTVSSGTANSLESPYAYVYDYTGSDVGEAKTLENYNTYGALYNFVAVEQWELCPVGWSVPSDDQFIQLEISAGLNSEEAESTGLRGSQGSDLKSLIWGGTDVLGFGAIPAGYKNDVSNLQSFNQIHDACYWWTSSPSIIEASSQGTIEQTAMEHSLFSDQEGIARVVSNRRHGFSARCVKD